MFRLLSIFIPVIFAISISFGQETSTKTLAEAINELSQDSCTLDLEYDEKLTTFIIKIQSDSTKQELFKMVKDDIHPEGIFRMDIDGNTLIRILSLNNEAVFVAEKVVNGHRKGTNVPFIDLCNLNGISKCKISKFVKLFKKQLSSPKPKNSRIINVSPPKVKQF